MECLLLQGAAGEHGVELGSRCRLLIDVTQYVAGGWFSAQFPLGARASCPRRGRDALGPTKPMAVGGGLKPPPTRVRNISY